jgi:hypothetical protein
LATAPDIALLRCEADRLASLAVKDGVTLSPPSQVAPALDPAFVAWIADVGGYAITLWELELLRSLKAPSYSGFNAVFDNLQRFVDAPSARSLEPNVVTFTALFSAAATRRSVPGQCGLRLTFPGLEPPDARILPQNLPDDLDVPSPPPPMHFKLPFGIKITLGASGAILLLGLGAAWAIRHRRSSSRYLPPPV